MKQVIATTHQIAADPARIWAIISRADGVDGWLPIITTCRLEGQGEGAKRICGTAAGDLLETIVKIDQATRTFQYAINEQPLLPITNILVTMVVEEADGLTLLRWTLAGDLVDEAQAAMVQEAIAGMYAAGAAGLARVAQGG